MEFNFNAATEIWDAENHKWVVDTAASWSVITTGGDKITVKNNSSKAVSASFAFTAADDNGITGTFTAEGLSNNTATRTVAEENTAAVAFVVTFAPNGTLDDTHVSGATIGTITVTIQ